MTDEEIKKMCTEYADGMARWFPELKERNKYRDKVAQAGNVIRLIQRDYCIVPKEQVYMRHGVANALMEQDPARREFYRGQSSVLESIFGKDTFEE